MCRLWATSGGGAAMPLQGVKVHVTVLDLLLKVDIWQRYVNNESDPIETEFVFPLPDSSATISAFEALIGGRKIVGTVKPKDEAADLYSDSIAEGHGAFLLERDSRGEAFRASVGALPPGESCCLKITYLTTATMVGEMVSVKIPKGVLSDAPATAGGSSSRSQTDEDSFPQEGFELLVTLEMASSIKSISSPSHPIEAELGEQSHKATVRLSGEEGSSKFLAKDFVVNIKQSQPSLARGWIERNPETGEEEAAMVCFYPRFQNKIKPDVVFVVDRSGSMRKEGRMQAAKDALQLFLRGLPVGSHFNVVSFGTRHHMLWTQSRPYNDRTLKEAAEYVDSMKADMQETNLFGPLSAIFRTQPAEGLTRQIFILTDGALPDTKKVLDLVEQYATYCRVFTLGLGAGVSYYLVRELARLGKGSAEFCKVGDRIETKIMKQLKQACSDSFYNVSLNWKLPSSKLTAATYIPPVFSGQPLLAFALLPGGNAPDSVSLKGETADGTVIRYEVELLQGASALETGRFISVLAAQNLIHDLEGQRSDSKADAHFLPPANEVKNKILDLALKYGLASHYTSFVAVDERKTQTLGSMQRRIISSSSSSTTSASSPSKSGASAPKAPSLPQQSNPHIIKRRGVPQKQVTPVVPPVTYQQQLQHQRLQQHLQQQQYEKEILLPTQQLLKESYQVTELNSIENLSARCCEISTPAAPSSTSGPSFLTSIFSYFGSSASSTPQSSSSSRSKKRLTKLCIAEQPSSGCESKRMDMELGRRTRQLPRLYEAEWCDTKAGVDDDDFSCKEERKAEEEDEEEDEEQERDQEVKDCAGREARPVISFKDKESIFKQLALKQNASGCWNFDPALLHLLSIENSAVRNAFKDLTLSDTEQQDQVWATAIAVAYLQNELAEFQTEWEMLHMKAEAWLNEATNGEESSWIQAAANLF